MKNLFKAGEIILIAYPFTDLTQQKVRPALIISDQTDHDILIAPISTTVNQNRDDYIIKKQDYETYPLPVQSCIRYKKIFTLDSKLIIKTVSRLNKATTKKIKEKLANYILG